MDLSIPLAGLQSADQAFDSAARSIVNAFDVGQTVQPGTTSIQGDSVSLSSAVVGLLSSSLSFLANEKTAIVESNTIKSTFSLLG